MTDTQGIDHGDLPDVPEAGQGGGTSTVTVDDVTEAMKDVVDPELGINVVDLGLVYGVHLDEHSNAVLDMTLTSAACPLTDVITDQTESALEGRPWTAETARAAGEVLREEGTPIDDHRASAGYRRATLATMLVRLHTEGAAPASKGVSA